MNKTGNTACSHTYPCYISPIIFFLNWHCKPIFKINIHACNKLQNRYFTLPLDVTECNCPSQLFKRTSCEYDLKVSI